MTALSQQTARALAEALSRLDSRADRLRKQAREDAWRDEQDAKPIDWQTRAARWKVEAARWKAAFENSERTVKRLLDEAEERNRQVRKARELFEELHEYLDGMSDIEDGDYGEPRPNREMTLCIDINWMLEALK